MWRQWESNPAGSELGKNPPANLLPPLRRCGSEMLRHPGPLALSDKPRLAKDLAAVN